MENTEKFRKTYSDDFKAKVGMQALKEYKTAQEIAKENNISTKLVYNWRSQIEKNIVNVFKQQSKLNKELENKNLVIEGLQLQIGQLVTESDWLKKILKH